MGVFKNFVNSLFEDEPEKDSSLEKLSEEPSIPKKDKSSFISRLVDSCFEDANNDNDDNNKPGFMSRLIDSLFEDPSEISFTDSDDIASTSEGVIGKIKEYKKRLDMISIAVDTIDKDSFPRAKEVIVGYLELALKFKRELEPYINTSMNNIPASTGLKLQISLTEFEKDFQAKVPEVKSLIWFNEMTDVNKHLKRIFETGTLTDITPNRIQKYYNYVSTIASQKDTFTGYKNELIHELLIAEYRLTMISLMKKIGLGEKVTKSPFAGLDSKKISEFEQLFMDDYYASSSQYNYIMDLKRRYIATGKFSENVFSELTTWVDTFDERLSTFMLDDYSISEIFSDSPDCLNDLKLFIKIKLVMNTMNSKYRKAIDEREIGD